MEENNITNKVFHKSMSIIFRFASFLQKKL